MNEEVLFIYIYIKYGRARDNSRGGDAGTERVAGGRCVAALEVQVLAVRGTSEGGRTLPVAGVAGGRGHRNVSLLLILIHSIRFTLTCSFM